MVVLYQAADPLYWVIWLFILFALMAFNELGRTSLWAGIALFAVVPIVLTVFVWPITAAPGNEYGTGTWFNWVKTYSHLPAAWLHGAALREVARRGRHDAPPVREALGAVLSAAHPGRQHRRGRRSRLPGVQLRPVARRRGREPVDYVGSLEHHERHCRYPHIVTICGWFGIFISKDSSKDMIWPDMMLGVDHRLRLWNFAYTYNCISDHSAYAPSGTNPGR